MCDFVINCTFSADSTISFYILTAFLCVFLSLHGMVHTEFSAKLRGACCSLAVDGADGV